MAGDRKALEKGTGTGSWEGVFYFHPHDGIYKDHFPGYPVVPGSLIVHAFLKAAGDAGFLPDYLAIENFRFREFLSPGHYSFRIEFDEERLYCLIHREERKLVTGVLKR
jgi:3-hydroxyacyl-[acyl-carrier-protein] dehydratase